MGKLDYFISVVEMERSSVEVECFLVNPSLCEIVDSESEENLELGKNKQRGRMMKF